MSFQYPSSNQPRSANLSKFSEIADRDGWTFKIEETIAVSHGASENDSSGFRQVFSLGQRLTVGTTLIVINSFTRRLSSSNSDKVSLTAAYSNSGVSLRPVSRRCATGEISRQNNSWTKLLFDVHAESLILRGRGLARFPRKQMRYKIVDSR